MGPPPFGDGDRGDLPAWTVLCPASSFNGATAFRRWKSERWKCGKFASVLQACFNGATAFRRWKSGGTMRLWGTMYAIQWGHRLSAMEIRIGLSAGVRDQISTCFNGATAFRRWRSGGPVAGRDLSWVFNGATAFDNGDPPSTAWSWSSTAASMGPPPFGDGDGSASLSDPSRRQRRREASMGPPPFGDGDSSWAGSILGDASPEVLLQWGHRLSAMEIGTWKARAILPPPDRCCFNGATAFRRWRSPRCLLVASWTRKAAMLQWGHRLSAMEMPAWGVSNGRQT